MPPPLIVEALAIRAEFPVSPEAPLLGELTSEASLRGSGKTKATHSKAARRIKTMLHALPEEKWVHFEPEKLRGFLF